MKNKKASHEKAHFSRAELATLDSLITIAQQQGQGFDDVFADDDLDDVSGAAETVEARHDGIFRLLDEQNHLIVDRIRELSQELGAAPTLRQLLELRARAVRGG
jgi:hypothetical protein